MLKEKLKKWLEKIQRRKGEFRYFQNVSGVWRLLDTREGVAIEVDTIYLRIEDGEKILCKMHWRRNDKCKTERNFKVIFKDEEKLIIEIDENEIYGFGFGDLGKKERVLFGYRIDKMLYIIWASSADTVVGQALGINARETITTECLDSLLEMFNNVASQEGGA